MSILLDKTKKAFLKISNIFSVRKSFDKLSNFLSRVPPVKIITYGYLFNIIFGFIVLSLPICQTSSIKPIDNFFIVSSAVSTTGLVSIVVCEKYNYFGQFILFALIQFSGIGYMTFASFLILTTRKVLNEQARMVFQTVYSFPENFKVESFLVHVISFTFIIESLGAIGLYFAFSAAGVDNALWQAVFASMSAFCTAGFTLFPDNLMGFRDDFWVNAIISALSLLGAIGFIVFVDVWKMIKGYQSKITLTSKIILVTTGWMLVIGTILTIFTEHYEQANSVYQRILISFFHVTAAMSTAGFNTIDVSVMTKSTLMLLILYMIIGGSPSGTGGGIKTTTFTVMLGYVKSAIQGRKEITFWNAVIPEHRVRTAMASLCFYVSTYILGTYLLSLAEQKDILTLAFETASALGTVGLSMNCSPALTDIGKIIVSVIMYIGRVGPLVFGFAVFAKPQLIYNPEKQDLAV